jgi:hypothetical protein
MECHRSLTYYLLQMLAPPQDTSNQYRLPIRGGGFGLDGSVKHAVEMFHEGGRVLEWDTFEKKGLVEE